MSGLSRPTEKTAENQNFLHGQISYSMLFQKKHRHPNYGDGKADVYVAGKNGTLTFHVNGDDPSFDIADPAKGPMKYRACWGISINGRMEGWLVDEQNRISWFPKPPELPQPQPKPRPRKKKG
jgi:hypothetical protein